VSVILTDIFEGVRDMYEAEELTDAQLRRFVARAVRFYSRFNPYEDSDTVTTVVDQQDYTLPDEFLFMRDVEYYPAGQLFGQLHAGSPTAEYELMLHRPARYAHPSDRVIERINRQGLADAIKGKWEIVGGKTLRLWPVPSSVAEYTYYYGALHELNEASTGYDTIPDEDLDIVVSLTLAEALTKALVNVSTEFDYAEGLQRVTKHFVPDNVTATVKMLRDTVRGKYKPRVFAIS
jgi:hypothetical protein